MCLTALNEFIFSGKIMPRLGKFCKRDQCTTEDIFWEILGNAIAKRLKTGKCSNFQKRKQEELDVYLVQRFSHQETSGYIHSTYYILLIAYIFDFLFLTAEDLADRRFGKVHNKLSHRNP